MLTLETSILGIAVVIIISVVVFFTRYSMKAGSDETFSSPFLDESDELKKKGSKQRKKELKQQLKPKTKKKTDKGKDKGNLEEQSISIQHQVIPPEIIPVVSTQGIPQEAGIVKPTKQPQLTSNKTSDKNIVLTSQPSLVPRQVLPVAVESVKVTQNQQPTTSKKETSKPKSIVVDKANHGKKDTQMKLGQETVNKPIVYSSHDHHDDDFVTIPTRKSRKPGKKGEEELIAPIKMSEKSSTPAVGISNKEQTVQPLPSAPELQSSVTNKHSFGPQPSQVPTLGPQPSQAPTLQQQLQSMPNQQEVVELKIGEPVQKMLALLATATVKPYEADLLIGALRNKCPLEIDNIETKANKLNELLVAESNKCRMIECKAAEEINKLQLELKNARSQQNTDVLVKSLREENSQLSATAAAFNEMKNLKNILESQFSANAKELIKEREARKTAETKLSTLQDEFNNIKLSTIPTAQNQINTLSDQLKTTDQRNKDLQRDLDISQNSLKLYVETNRNLENEIRGLRETCENLKSENASCIQALQNTKLRESGEGQEDPMSSGPANSQMEEFNSKIHSLEKLLAEKESKVLERETEIKKSLQEVDLHKQKFKEIATEVEILKKHLHESEAQVEDLKKQLAVNTDKMFNSEQDKLATLESVNSQLEMTNNELSKRVSDLVSTAEEDKNKIASLQNSNETLLKQLQQHSDGHKNVDNDSTLETLQKELEQVKEQLQIETKNLQLAQTTNTLLQQREQELQTNEIRLKQQVIDMETSLNKSNSEVKQLTDEVTHCKQLLNDKNKLVDDDQKASSNEIEVLRNELGDVKGKLQAETNSLQKALDDNTNLQKQLHHACNTEESSQKRIGDLEAIVHTFEADLKKAQNEVLNYKQVLDETKNILTNLQKSVDEEEAKWKEELALSEKERETLQEELRRVYSELKSKEDSREVIIINDRRRKMDLADVNFAMGCVEKSLTTIVDEMKVRINELEEELAKVNKEHAQTSTELEALKSSTDVSSHPPLASPATNEELRVHLEYKDQEVKRLTDELILEKNCKNDLLQENAMLKNLANENSSLNLSWKVHELEDTSKIHELKSVLKKDTNDNVPTVNGDTKSSQDDTHVSAN